MRVVALIAAYNERRFIGPCLEHLHGHGVDAYLIDNGSTDETVELAERWSGKSLIDIESFPRGAGDVYNWHALLRRKEELAGELEADWLIHLDPDEVRLPPTTGLTLAEALEEADRAGYNAVNSAELTFVPTRESPDHDHPDFQRTMRSYYSFAPAFPHQLKAWKRTEAVELAWSGGHQVRFPELKMCPRPFLMKHYLFLSAPHAIEKFVERRYDPVEVDTGWHGWRATLTPEDIQARLPSESQLRTTASDDDLDPSEPRKRHYMDARAWTEGRVAQPAPAGFHLIRTGPREEPPPAGTVGRPRIVHRGDGRRAEIALTFDDGPSRWTEEVAACFEEHGSHATFFLRGAAIATQPNTVAALTAAGHELGNHLWSHTDALKLSLAELRAEIERTAVEIQAAGAPRPDLLRPPYFSGPEAVAEAAEGMGVSAVVLRSIGSSDWQAKSAEEVFAPILASAEAGDIVCLHDGVSGTKRDSDSREVTAAAVQRLVPALLDRGLRPVTVSRLLR